MAATTAALPQEGSRHSWIFAAVGLVAFAAAGGVALATSEFDAFWLTLGATLCIAVMFDFRVGVVSLIVMLPISDSGVFFPHALMGVPALNPINLLIAATLLSYVLRGRLGAKTGTLDDASALSGYVHSRNGHQIVFSILVNHRRLNILAAHKLQDRIVQALAGSRPRG
jgi:hypothetical protein